MTFTLLKDPPWCRIFRALAISPILLVCLGLPTPAAGQGPDDTATGVDDEPEEEPEETDPIVLAFRGLNPQTAPQLTRAIQAMYRINRPDEAKVYLTQLAGQNPTDDVLADLAREFGGRLFLALRNAEAYAPEGRAFADRVLNAYGAQLKDEARLADLAARRAKGEPGALRGLVESGRLAVPAIVAEMGASDDATAIGRLAATLLQIGPEAVQPLTAALQTDDEQTVAAIAEVLGKLADARAAKYLVRPAFSASLSPATRQAALTSLLSLLREEQVAQRDAERFLAKKALAVYRGVQGRELGEFDDVWVWDAEAYTVKPLVIDRHAGRCQVAARLASDLAALRPEDGPVQDLALSARLEAAKSLVEPGSPLIVADSALFAELQREPPTRLIRVLDFSLENEQAAAATAVCEVLAEVGPSLLATEGVMKPLMRAVTHRNRRLQFAGCRAVMETTDRDAEFTGSSRWLSRVGYFLCSAGVPKAVVADTVDERGQTLAGRLNAQGIVSGTAKTGADLIAAIVDDPDVELILIHERLNRPLLAETLQLIRNDFRTAAIPVAILKDGGDEMATDRLAENDPLTISVPHPVTDEYTALIAGRLLQLNRSSIPLAAERQRQAGRAADWLLRQTENSANLWQLQQIEKDLHVAVGNPGLAPQAATLLGRLANEDSQRRLLELLNTDSESAEARTAALDAFSATVEKRGILLGGSEIREQMRIAKSRRSDSFVQEAFAIVLKRLAEEKK